MNKVKRVNFRITELDERLVELMADMQGMSKSDIMRNLIRQAAAKRGLPVSKKLVAYELEDGTVKRFEKGV